MGQTERNIEKQKIDRLTKTRITNRPIIFIRLLLVLCSQRHCFLRAVYIQNIYNWRCYRSNNTVPSTYPFHQSLYFIILSEMPFIAATFLVATQRRHWYNTVINTLELSGYFIYHRLSIKNCTLL
jgi:hypothetical protein